MTTSITGWSGLPFLAEPVPKSENWRLQTDPIFTGMDGTQFQLKRGLLSNGGSVPRLLWWIVGHPFDPDFVKESFFHDALCRSGLFPVKYCDELMIEALYVGQCPMEKIEQIDAGLTISRLWRRKPQLDPRADLYIEVVTQAASTTQQTED